MYFEDFEIGYKITTQARTITEADVVNFAGLSGDYNAIHTDAAFAETAPFGQRVAHGLLVLSIVTGLAMRTGFLEGTVLAFREISNWKFSKPVFIGDTVHAEIEITNLKAFPRLGGGALDVAFKVINQDYEIVMKGSFNILVQSKPSLEPNQS
ncbi:MAG: dehydratase [Anaerolineales bacterium]|nr:dehydratase [Anaerolineales bacterium]